MYARSNTCAQVLMTFFCFASFESSRSGLTTIMCVEPLSDKKTSDCLRSNPRQQWAPGWCLFITFYWLTNLMTWGLHIAFYCHSIGTPVNGHQFTGSNAMGIGKQIGLIHIYIYSSSDELMLAVVFRSFINVIYFNVGWTLGEWYVLVSGWMNNIVQFTCTPCVA